MGARRQHAQGGAAVQAGQLQAAGWRLRSAGCAMRVAVRASVMILATCFCSFLQLGGPIARSAASTSDGAERVGLPLAACARSNLKSCVFCGARCALQRQAGPSFKVGAAEAVAHSSGLGLAPSLLNRASRPCLAGLHENHGSHSVGAASRLGRGPGRCWRAAGSWQGAAAGHRWGLVDRHCRWLARPECLSVCRIGRHRDELPPGPE